MKSSEESISRNEKCSIGTVLVRELGSAELDGELNAELTKLLHRAFKKSPKQPYDYPASRQDDKTTREHIERGKCWLAFLDERIVGLGIVWPPRKRGRHFVFFKCPRRVAQLRHLAVDPDYQGFGIGKMLLRLCEENALLMGATELAGGYPVGARQHSLYSQMGYRIVKYISYSNTSYESVVFSKYLNESNKPSYLWIGIEKLEWLMSLVKHKFRLFK